MKSQICTCIAIVIALLGCASSVEEVTVTNSEQEYTETFAVNKGTNVKNGPYTKKTLNGDLIEEAVYVNGKMEGVQKIYERNRLYSVSHFKNGQYQGKYETYYPSGQINVEGDYVDNVMHGKWKVYYQTGQIKEVVTFANNEENGPFVEFYPNGNVKAEGEYLNGDNEHGMLYLYDINGILIKKMNCEHGICRTTWVKEGKEDAPTYRNADKE